jgi:hypothetical protein
MAADILIKAWTCSGTASQYTPLLASFSVPNCSPASAGAWQTFTIKQNDPPNMANTEQFIYYGIEVLVFAIGALLFAKGFSSGQQR